MTTCTLFTDALTNPDPIEDLRAELISTIDEAECNIESWEAEITELKAKLVSWKAMLAASRRRLAALPKEEE